MKINTENINPEIKKILFLVPFVVVVIIIFFSISKKDNNKVAQGNVSMQIPEAEDIELYASKTEAYTISKADSLRKARANNQSINLNIGNLLNVEETKKDTNFSPIAETNIKDLFNNNNESNIDTTTTQTAQEGMKQLTNLLASLEDQQQISNRNPASTKTKTKKNPRNSNKKPVFTKGKPNINQNKKLSSVTPKIKPKRKIRKKSNVSEKSSTNSPIIKAAIYSQQTVYSGSRVKMILQNDITIEDKTIPKNTFIYGEAVLGKERVKINIYSVIYNEKIYPIKLTVHDNDGIAGVFIPGGITQDISKESSSEALNQVRSTKTGFGSQLLTATQNVAKKWQRRDFAVIPAGYKIFLKF